MAKRLPPLSWTQQQRNAGVGPAASSMWAVPWQETVCLTCDVRARAAQGESPAAIAVRFGIPRFLVEAVLEPDSHPTRTLRKVVIVDPARS